MKILLVHNYYGTSAPSGENNVFEAERAMLEKHGHEVRVYMRHSDEIRKVASGGCLIVWLRKLKGVVKGALCTMGNPFVARAITRICREFNPDVVHFHNTFPLISPLAVRAASKYAPVVLTLHNYRVACAAGFPTREGRVCSLCLDKKCALDGARYRCYRGSLLASLPLILNIALYRRRLPKWVSRFIVLSEFQKQKMVRYGFPEKKIMVKGNYVERVVGGAVDERVEKKSQIVYVGRLSKEKGVATLIKAFYVLRDWAKCEKFSTCSVRLNELKLVIVGDGVDLAKLEKLAKGLNVEFVGLKSRREIRRLMSESKATVLPSEWWETFGLVVVESMLEGTPVVVSNLGALPEIVHSDKFGEVFKAGNVESLAEGIAQVVSRSDYADMCAAARHEAETKYSAEINYLKLIGIYESAVCG